MRLLRPYRNEFVYSDTSVLRENLYDLSKEPPISTQSGRLIYSILVNLEYTLSKD